VASGGRQRRAGAPAWWWSVPMEWHWKQGGKRAVLRQGWAAELRTRFRMLCGEQGCSGSAKTAAPPIPAEMLLWGLFCAVLMHWACITHNTVISLSPAKTIGIFCLHHLAGSMLLFRFLCQSPEGSEIKMSYSKRWNTWFAMSGQVLGAASRPSLVVWLIIAVICWRGFSWYFAEGSVDYVLLTYS